MFCNKCGKQIENGTFCTECDKIEKSSINNENEILKELIGKNQYYYLNQFEKIKNSGKSFNWCAFLFSSLFILYRKQYSYFLKMYTPYYIIFALIIQFCVLSRNVNSLYIIAVPILIFIAQVYFLIIIISAGKNFNNQYMCNLKKSIKNEQFDKKNIFESFQTNRIKRKYHPSFLPPIVFIILSFLLVIIIFSFTKDLIFTNDKLFNYSENYWDFENSEELEEPYPTEITEPTTYYEYSIFDTKYKNLHDLQSNGAMDLVKFYTNIFNNFYGITLAEDSKIYIQKKALFFPATTADNIEKVERMSGYSAKYENVSQDIKTYNDVLIVAEGFVNDISKTESKDGIIYTEAQIIDSDNNIYDVLYLDDIDVIKGDNVIAYGIPISNYNYDNIGGGITYSILILGSYMKAGYSYIGNPSWGEGYGGPDHEYDYEINDIEFEYKNSCREVNFINTFPQEGELITFNGITDGTGGSYISVVVDTETVYSVNVYFDTWENEDVYNLPIGVPIKVYGEYLGGVIDMFISADGYYFEY